MNDRNFTFKGIRKAQKQCLIDELKFQRERIIQRLADRLWGQMLIHGMALA